ncbi:hypothetical protein ACDX78_01500 [Virgibacillus oceani]
MVIKIGNHTITSAAIFKVMFVMVLMATIGQVILNILTAENIITGMVVFSAAITCVCYYLSKDAISNEVE